MQWHNRGLVRQGLPLALPLERLIFRSHKAPWQVSLKARSL